MKHYYNEMAEIANRLIELGFEYKRNGQDKDAGHAFYKNDITIRLFETHVRFGISLKANIKNILNIL